jgi:hypothetical protein
MPKELSIVATAKLCGVSPPYIHKLIELGTIRKPLTRRRVQAQWAVYEATKAKRQKVRAIPGELDSLLAIERARSLELKTGLLNHSLLDNEKVASDIASWIAALRNGLYIAVANLPDKRAGEDGADAILSRLSEAVGKHAEALRAGDDEVPPAAAPAVPEDHNAKQREARARLLYRRTRNQELADKTISRDGAELVLRTIADVGTREMAAADIGVPLGELIEAMRARTEQIISDWRAGVEDQEGDDDDEE